MGDEALPSIETFRDPLARVVPRPLDIDRAGRMVTESKRQVADSFAVVHDERGVRDPLGPRTPEAWLPQLGIVVKRTDRDDSGRFPGSIDQDVVAVADVLKVPRHSRDAIKPMTVGELVALGRRIMAVGAEERALAKREGYKVRDTFPSAEGKVRDRQAERERTGAYIAALWTHFGHTCPEYGVICEHTTTPITAGQSVSSLPTWAAI